MEVSAELSRGIKYSRIPGEKKSGMYSVIDGLEELMCHIRRVGRGRAKTRMGINVTHLRHVE